MQRIFCEVLAKVLRHAACPYSIPPINKHIVKIIHLYLNQISSFSLLWQGVEPTVHMNAHTLVNFSSLGARAHTHTHTFLVAVIIKVESERFIEVVFPRIKSYCCKGFLEH